MITVLATFACIIVLVRSQDVPIDAWQGPFQPTVYISICTAIANITLTYALYEGVVISFWRKAGEGATLRELHQYWLSGSSLYGAFQGIFGFRGKTTALACIMTVISIGRGPLMQRASSVKNTVIRDEGNVTVYSAMRLPLGYAGLSTGRSSTPSMMNPTFTKIYQAYTNRGDIDGSWAGCDSTCYAEVRGFGFGVSCNISGIPYSLSPVLDPDGSATLIDPVEVYTADASQIRSYDYVGSVEDTLFNSDYSFALLLNTTFLGNRTEDNNGFLTSHLCALRGGIVSYPITISNKTITLQSLSWGNDTFLEDWGLLGLTSGQATNIAGFILAAKGLYEGTASYQFGGAVSWILQLNGASANRYLQGTYSGYNLYNLTAVTWSDPMEDMINSMREVAFRTSLQIAADNTSYANARQNVPSRNETPKTVYTANYSYMASAVALSLLGVVAVIPTYSGFWKLGRPVSLSPLEVAKAFNSPVLGELPGNRPAEKMLDEAGGMKFRYGESGVVVGTSGYAGEEEVRKIEIGPVAVVKAPEKGARYI